MVGGTSKELKTELININSNDTYTDTKTIETNTKYALDSILISRAALLARSGRLNQAMELISPMVYGKCMNRGAVELLAKIYAQQGRVDDAIRLWKNALEIDPGNPDYSRAIKRCLHFKKSKLPSSIKLLKTFLTVLVLVVLAAAIIALGVIQTGRQLRKVTALVQEALKVETAINRTLINNGNKIDIFVSEFKKTRIQSIPETDIDTQTISVQDEDIEMAVSKALLSHEVTRKLFLTVARNGSTIEITGKVPSLEIWYLVEAIVKSVPGMKSMNLTGLVISQTYIVQDGDSLWSIAEKFYGDPNKWGNIAMENELPMPYLLNVGQELEIN